MDNPIEKIYSELRHHYQLLFLFDLYGYKENDLTSLSMRLQGQMGLDRRERQIHEELIRKSESNVAKRLEEKARKRQEKSTKKGNSHLPEFLMSGTKEEEEGEYIEQNCIIGSYPYQEEEVQYKETQSYCGNFINGRMTILLPIGLNDTEPMQKAFFEIIPQQNFSQITRATLEQCNFKLNSESVTLSIACKPSQFKITDGESNILGMSYLRNNNIITRGNYRSQQSMFTMIFTE